MREIDASYLDTDIGIEEEEYTDLNDWKKPITARLIEERRKIPKEERLEMFRNDSIDEIDTTDLENW